MRVAFAVIVVLHGLIHLLGFAQAFGLAKFKGISRPIPRALGLLWLLSAVLFLLTAVLYLAKTGQWWIPAFAGAILSQMLIIILWKDARVGTIPNLLVLLVSIIALAGANFSGAFEEEVVQLLAERDQEKPGTITSQTVAHLPLPVQRWLRHSGLIGREEIRTVRLRQKALMRMSPEQEDWSLAEAEQVFTVHPPAFVWAVRMQMMSFIDIAGRDKFQNGKGEMVIKILSLFPIVDSRDNDRTNTGTLQRYLGEIVWFPSAALSPEIKWESIDDTSAGATMTYGGTTGSGVFHFDLDGGFKKFVALRYMGADGDAKPQPWVIEVTESGIRNNVRIPTRMTATWKLETGDWTWLQLELTDISYDTQTEK